MQIVMPKLSATMEQGTIVTWHKSAGDLIAAGELIVDIETDKATLGIEAPVAGRLGAPAVGVGESAAVGSVLVEISSDDHASTSKSERLSADSRAPRMDAPAIPSGDPPPEVNVSEGVSGRILSSPAARRIARDANMSLLGLQGSGPGGRIVSADVHSALERGQPQLSENQRQLQNPKPPRSRRLIAAEVTASRREIPSFALSRWIDLEAVLAHRERTARGQTLVDYFLYATATAISEVPAFASVWDVNHSRPEPLPTINIGLVVSANDGLLIPIVKNVDALGLAACTRARESAVRAARDGHLDASVIGRASVSLSCMLREEADSFDAIISPGQSAIVAVARERECVVPHKGAAAVRRGCAVTVSVDHRVIDGRAGARFLGHLAETLEKAAFRT